MTMLSLRRTTLKKHLVAAFLAAFLPWTLLASSAAPILCFESDGHVQLERSRGPDHMTEHDHGMVEQGIDIVAQSAGDQGAECFDLPLWAGENQVKRTDLHGCGSLCILRAIPSYTALQRQHLLPRARLAIPSSNPDLLAQRSIVLLN